jgi:hypothetical protein
MYSPFSEIKSVNAKVATGVWMFTPNKKLPAF